MTFPLLDGEQPYVLIVKGDGFPCGSLPWVQLAIGYASHGQKARTLAYNWTIDVALTSEHDMDALREMFSKTLEAMQGIINTGWILIREKWCPARVMLGGDSPWLRKVLGISVYFCIGSIYTYAVWCDLKGKWEDGKLRRSPTSDKKLYKLHKKGLDCTNAKECVSEPLLHIEERFKFVVMCILHLVRAEACCCVRWCLLEVPNEGYRPADSCKSKPHKGDKKPKKGEEFVRIPSQSEDDEDVAADVMCSVCAVPGKTSFTNADDAVQALKKMNQGGEDKGVGKEDNANDKVTEATEDKEKEEVLGAKAKGGGDESDGDGIAESSGAGDPSHDEGVMEPNGDGDGDAGKMHKGESPPNAQ